MPQNVINNASIFSFFGTGGVSGRRSGAEKVGSDVNGGSLGEKPVVQVKGGSRKSDVIHDALLKSFDAVNISSEAKQQVKEILLMGAKSVKEVRGNVISGADALKAFDIAAKGFLGMPKATAQEPQVPIAKRTIQQVTKQSAPASPQNVKLASEIVGYLSTKRFASPDGKPLLSPKETETLTNTLSRHGVLLDSFRNAVQTKNTAARDKLLRDIVTQFASKSLFSSSAHPPISRNSARRMMLTDMTNFAGELFGLTRDEKYKVWDALNKDFRLSLSNPEKAQRFLQNWEANYKVGKGHGLLAIVVNQTLGKGRATKGVQGQKPGATKEFFKAAFGEAKRGMFDDAVVIGKPQVPKSGGAPHKASVGTKASVADFEIVEKGTVESAMLDEQVASLKQQTEQTLRSLRAQTDRAKT